MLGKSKSPDAGRRPDHTKSVNTHTIGKGVNKTTAMRKYPDPYSFVPIQFGKGEYLRGYSSDLSVLGSLGCPTSPR